jgi:hypothetical protein
MRENIALQPQRFAQTVAGLPQGQQQAHVQRNIGEANFDQDYFENYGVGADTPISQTQAHQMYTESSTYAQETMNLDPSLQSYAQVSGQLQDISTGNRAFQPDTVSILDVSATKLLKRANKEAHTSGGDTSSLTFQHAQRASAVSAKMAGVDPSALNAHIQVGRMGASTPLTAGEDHTYGSALSHGQTLLKLASQSDDPEGAISAMEEQIGSHVSSAGNARGTSGGAGFGGFGGGGRGGGMGGGAGGGDGGRGNNDLIIALNKLREAVTQNTTGQKALEGPKDKTKGKSQTTAPVDHDARWNAGVNDPFIQQGFGVDPQGQPRSSGLNWGGGFLSGLTGGQATATDTIGRRRAKGLGRAVGWAGSRLGAGARNIAGGASIGGDIYSMLQSVPGFSRGFEGLPLHGEWVKMGAGGELPAMQASMQMGLSGNHLMPKQFGDMDAGAEFGISKESMGGLVLPWMQQGAGGVDQSDVARFTRGMAGGEDIGGIASLVGQQRMAGFRDNRALEFNEAKAQGLTGAGATGFASNLFGAFRGLTAGSGLSFGRQKTEERILGMGGGDIEAGSARFQRGQGVFKSAGQELMSPFEGLASTLLMAEAMQASAGDWVKAKRRLEQGEKNPNLARGRLGKLGLSRDVTQASLLAGGYTTEDLGMMGKTDSMAGGDKFDLLQASGGDGTRFSSPLAKRRNKQLDDVYHPSGQRIFDVIQKAEKKAEDELITNLQVNIGSLDALTDVVIKLNHIITGIVTDGSSWRSGRNDLQKSNLGWRQVVSYFGWLHGMGIK